MAEKDKKGKKGKKGGLSPTIIIGLIVAIGAGVFFAINGNFNFISSLLPGRGSKTQAKTQVIPVQSNAQDMGDEGGDSDLLGDGGALGLFGNEGGEAQSLELTEHYNEGSEGIDNLLAPGSLIGESDGGSSYDGDSMAYPLTKAPVTETPIATASVPVTIGTPEDSAPVESSVLPESAQSVDPVSAVVAVSAPATVSQAQAVIKKVATTSKKVVKKPAKKAVKKVVKKTTAKKSTAKNPIKKVVKKAQPAKKAVKKAVVRKKR